MRIYHLKYWRDGLFKETKANYFVTIPNEDVLNQFILDEEKRSGYTVYCQPVTQGDYDLVLFSRVSCSAGNQDPVSVPIFTEREAKEYEGLN